MSTRRTTALAALVLAATASVPAQIAPPSPAWSEPALADTLATRVFEDRINQYVTLHRLLEGPLPLFRPARDVGEVEAAMRAAGDFAGRGSRHHVFETDLTDL